MNPYQRTAACCVTVDGVPQHLTLTGSVLGITDGNTVDLGPLLGSADVCLFDLFGAPINAESCNC